MSAGDERFMRIALSLGRRNLGHTGENPSVGCVIVAGEGARAEALMKEHANVAKDNVRALAKDEDGAVRGSTPLSILRAS